MNLTIYAVPVGRIVSDIDDAHYVYFPVSRIFHVGFDLVIFRLPKVMNICVSLHVLKQNVCL